MSMYPRGLGSQLGSLAEHNVRELRDRWVLNAFSTGPPDRDAVREAIEELYHYLSLPFPEHILWVRSPASGIVASHILNTIGDAKSDEVRRRVGDGRGEVVAKDIWGQIEGDRSVEIEESEEGRFVIVEETKGWAKQRDGVRRGFKKIGTRFLFEDLNRKAKAIARDKLSGETRSHIDNLLYGPVGLKLKEGSSEIIIDEDWTSPEPVPTRRATNRDGLNLRFLDRLAHAFRRELSIRIVDMGRNDHFNSWDGNLSTRFLEFVAISRAFGELEDFRVFDVLHEINRHVSWWRAGTDGIILAEKPITVGFDDEIRLHADGRFAWGYGDGYGHYAWHGTMMPEEWGKVRSEQWDPQWLLSTNNAEHRRILLEGVGFDRIIGSLKNRLIHTETIMIPYPIYRESTDAERLESIEAGRRPIIHIQIGTEMKACDMSLMDIEERIDTERVRLLKVLCPSTGSIYVLRVPPSVRTCAEARNWTFGDERIKFTAET